MKESNVDIEKTTNQQRFFRLGKQGLGVLCIYVLLRTGSDDLITASELCLAQHFGCHYCLKVFPFFALACAVTHRVKQVVTRELTRAMKT